MFKRLLPTVAWLRVCSMVLLCQSPILLFAQPCPQLSFSSGNPIAMGTADGAYAVFAADLDADGDVDVLSASFNDNKIAWYENLGGGNFGPQQVISTILNGALSVHAADLDGDGDLEVLSASGYDDKIAWYENLGGGSFGPQQVLTTNANGALSVNASELDGDGDLDAVVTSEDNSNALYLNTDGTFTDSGQQLGSNLGSRDVTLGDVDGDGDLDALFSTHSGSRLYFNSEGTFISGLSFSRNGDGIALGDVNGDGDLDILSGIRFFMQE